MNSTFQLILDDSSPLITYSPPTSLATTPDLQNAWNIFFSESGFPVTLGSVGNGSSSHLTSSDHASFSFSFQGSSLQLFGFANCTYDVSLDSNITAGATAQINDLLAQYSDIPPGEHTLTLTVHPSDLTSVLGFDYAAITVDTGAAGDVSSNIFDDTKIQFTGRWEYHINPISPNTFHSYHATNHTGDFLSFNFTGNAISVFGLLLPTNGLYNVSVDDSTPKTFSSESPSEQNSLLYFQSNFDPSIEHNIVLTNVVEGKTLIVEFMNVTSVPGAHGSGSSAINGSALSKGALAGVILGSLIAAFIFGLLLILFYLSRRKDHEYTSPTLERRPTSGSRFRHFQLPYVTTPFDVSFLTARNEIQDHENDSGSEHEGTGLGGGPSKQSEWRTSIPASLTAAATDNPVAPPRESPFLFSGVRKVTRKAVPPILTRIGSTSTHKSRKTESPIVFRRPDTVEGYDGVRISEDYDGEGEESQEKQPFLDYDEDRRQSTGSRPASLHVDTDPVTVPAPAVHSRTSSPSYPSQRAPSLVQQSSRSALQFDGEESVPRRSRVSLSGSGDVPLTPQSGLTPHSGLTPRSGVSPQSSKDTPSSGSHSAPPHQTHFPSIPEVSPIAEHRSEPPAYSE